MGEYDDCMSSDAMLWRKTWLPIATEDGEYAVVDGESATIGLVEKYSDGLCKSYSLKDYFAGLHDDMLNGKIRHLDVGDPWEFLVEFEEDQALQRYDAPLPIVSKPKADPNAAAFQLISALVERRWLELSPKGDPTALMELTTLTLKKRKARAQALIDAWKQSSDIRRVIADVDQLEGALQTWGV